jgi:hypothetical protein
VPGIGPGLFFQGGQAVGQSAVHMSAVWCATRSATVPAFCSEFVGNQICLTLMLWAVHVGYVREPARPLGSLPCRWRLPGFRCVPVIGPGLLFRVGEK